MFRNLAREAFSAVQSKLFPPYFTLQAICAALAIASHTVVFGSESRVGFLALCPAGILPLMNLFFVGPQTTQILLARNAAIEGSAEWQALHSKFFAWHGISSICNLGAFLGQLFYARFLSSQLLNKTDALK